MNGTILKKGHSGFADVIANMVMKSSTHMQL